MSMIAHTPPEPVEATTRRAMPLARKRRIHAEHFGRCVCGAKVPVSGPGVTYDHRIPIWFGSPDQDDRVRPLCDSCDAAKTPDDLTRIAKTKRQQRMMAPKPDRARGRKLQGRPFDKTKSRRFDRTVVARKVRL